MTEATAFWLLGGGLVLSALSVVLQRNPITSALSLVVALSFVAGLFALMEAHFIAVVQLIVYAGAIVVLFVFVLMLMNLTTMEDRGPPIRPGRALGLLLLSVLFVAEILLAVRSGLPSGLGDGYPPERIIALGGNSRLVGELLFSRYLLPFELAGLLLLVAVVGTVVMAKRSLIRPASADREASS